jgi:hypothetical protein
MKSAVLAVTALILLLLGAFVWNALQPASPSFVLRYRLTLEIETPQGLRQGSSVIETDVYINKNKAMLSEASGDRVETKGEAVFVDLGNGKNVIALLTGGPKGEWADWHRYFLLGVFRSATRKDRGLEDLAGLSGTAIVDETTRLSGDPLMPTIVTLADINDPVSAKILRWQHDYQQTFGVGYALRRATVEIVPNSMPVTKGIEARLPGLLDPEKWNAPLRALPWNVDRIRVGTGSFKRNF